MPKKKATEMENGEIIRKVNILGSEWKIIYRDDDPAFEDAKGYANGPAREIVIANPKVVALDNLAFSLKDEYTDMRRVVRHEIVHAFLMESGLDESSLPADAWATNEEMVDWFARQGPKIYKAWKEVDAD